MLRSVRVAVLALCLALASAFSSELPDGGKNWAVIVTGTRGWHNYRHQADACHAYQIVHRNGIPDERIVVMMYDDLAYNPQNPTPGILIHRPNGPNVYNGVPKDYTRNAVTPGNLLAVLKGDASQVNGGSGKVLQSGPNDHVFVYITGLGAPGILIFPEGDLSVKDLQETINYMHENNKYKRMVFYIDACESGSMMTPLPDNIDVYSTTAANSHESSYACYYDEERDTYLGDWFSVKWMEDSDVKDLTKETLLAQFELVKTESKYSHVRQFGNKTLAHMKLVEFQANLKTYISPTSQVPLEPVEVPGLIPSRDVPLCIMIAKIGKPLPLSVKRAIRWELRVQEMLRTIVNAKVRGIVKKVTGTETDTDEIFQVRRALSPSHHDCYQTSYTHFKTHCFNWQESEFEIALYYLFSLVNMCARGYTAESIKSAMDSTCVPLN